MKKTSKVQRLTDQYIFNTYRRYPVTIAKAKGSWVWDDEGRKYLDFFSGLAVSGIGHNLDPVVKAIVGQTKKFIHCSNYYYSEPAALLAEQLCERSFADRVFFCNSGTEANELAIKLGRRFGSKQGRYETIVFENGFHGRTMGALSATPQPKFHEGFGPMLPGFPVARVNDLDSVKHLINDKTAAILIEPIQGEGGIHPSTPEFLKALRALADAQGLLLIFDGVQCSLGRTGTLFSYEMFGVTPDILTLAKGLGGGMPIGAVLATERVASCIGPGDHGSTFGGNPVSCAASLAILKLLSPAFLKRIQKESIPLQKELKALATASPIVKEFRGVGYMLGLELKEPGTPYVEAARDRGLLINCTQTSVLRFLPPLALSATERSFALKILKEILLSGGY